CLELADLAVALADPGSGEANLERNSFKRALRKDEQNRSLAPGTGIFITTRHEHLPDLEQKKNITFRSGCQRMRVAGSTTAIALWFLNRGQTLWRQISVKLSKINLTIGATSRLAPALRAYR